MAVIEKLRGYSGIIIGAILVAMVAFLVTDALNSNTNIFGNRSNRPESVGKLYGRPIDNRQYDNRIQRALYSLRQQAGPDAIITPTQEREAKDRVWSQYLGEEILHRQTKPLGIEVTGDEIYALSSGPNPHAIAMQAFSDPKTGGYNPQLAYQFISGIADNPNPDAQAFYVEYENALVNTREREKFASLVSKAVYTTDLEIQDANNAPAQMANIQYVPLYTRTISDSSITVSDGQLREYFNKHKENFKREEGRNVQFVLFGITATQGDSLAAKGYLDRQAKSLTNRTDTSSLKRLVRTYTNKPLPRSAYVEQAGEELTNMIFNAADGAVVGPVLHNGKYKIAKVVDGRADSLTFYHASHILIQPSGSAESDSLAAEKKAKELMGQVTSDEGFAMLARTSSQDPGSAQKGGDLGFFADGQMVPRFMKGVKRLNKGGMTVVRSEFGAHLIRVIDAPSNRVVRAAILEREVQSGAKTETQSLATANQFSGLITNGKSFDDAANRLGLQIRVAENLAPNSRQVSGLEDARDMIKWAYDPDRRVGDVSEPRTMGSAFVVAHLIESHESGYPKIAEIRNELTTFVRDDIKKDQLAKKLSDAKGSSTDLNAIAKTVNTTVGEAQSVSFGTPNLPNLGNEPALVGATFGAPLNEVYGPIKGDQGVYLVKVTTLAATPPAVIPDEMEKARRALINNASSQAGSALLEGLRKDADIKDYRYIFE